MRNTVSAGSISIATPGRGIRGKPRSGWGWRRKRTISKALLGAMLFKGDDLSRQAALGLFWLTLAKDGARSDESWIAETYSSAFAQATDSERTIAYKYLENWLKGRRE